MFEQVRNDGFQVLGSRITVTVDYVITPPSGVAGSTLVVELEDQGEGGSMCIACHRHSIPITCSYLFIDSQHNNFQINY